MVTRRCSERRYFLRPSKRVNRIVEFIVAVVAGRTGVRIHALVAMSNHLHLVVTDPQARLPEFLRDVHGLVAKSINWELGRWENLWAAEQTSLVRVSGDDDVLGRIVYTLANPVQAKLVSEGRLWPGLRMAWPEVRRAVARPVGFFAVDGPMPDEVQLELSRPPGFEGASDEELVSILSGAVAERESLVRGEIAKSGGRFLGRGAVRKQSPFSRPGRGEPRRGMSPRVATNNKWRRIEALQRLREFLDQYRHAFRLWRAGFAEVVFPAGTYKLRVQGSIRCAEV